MGDVQIERTVQCHLSAYQQALIDIVRERMTRQPCKGVSINNSVMELRNICNHPFVSRLHVQVSPSCTACRFSFLSEFDDEMRQREL